MIYCHRKEFMASVRQPREKTMRERVAPFRTQKTVPKVGGFAAHFACGFFALWRGGTRSRIVFSRGFRALAISSFFQTVNSTVFLSVGQNGCPRRREAPRSISFDDTSLKSILSLRASCVLSFLGIFSKNLSKRLSQTTGGPREH